MNFKCWQEDHCSEDLLVSFWCSEYSFSLLGALLLAVTGPGCLYQHLAAIFLPHIHTHKHRHQQWWVCSSAYTFILTISHHEPSLCLSTQFPALPHISVPLCICTCNHQIYLAEAWWERWGVGREVLMWFLVEYNLLLMALGSPLIQYKSSLGKARVPGSRATWLGGF